MTTKTIIFNHLGFPIKLLDWPHIKVDGALVPDINYVQLEDAVFKMLPIKPSRLTGAELKFIRHHLELTQEAFSKWMADGTDASTVSKWEKQDLQDTGMLLATERSLRLQLIAMILTEQRRKTMDVTVIERLRDRITAKTRKPMQLRYPLSTKPPKDLFALA